MVNVLKLSIKINDEKSIVQFAEKINDNILTRTEQKSLAHFHLARHKLANGQNREAIQDLEFVIENSNNEETAEARYLISKIYRSEERRVGKEWRSRWWRTRSKKDRREKNM